MIVVHFRGTEQEYGRPGAECIGVPGVLSVVRRGR